MRKLVFFSCMQLAMLQLLNAGTCPSPISILPQLPIPAVVPPPVATCPTPTPATIPGYMPFTFVNDTGLLADDIYICVLVNSISQYLKFTLMNGHYVGTITDFTPTSYISEAQYTYPLSSFENISGSNYTFYIPNDGNTAVNGSNVMKSSRIFVSLKGPLNYFINNNGILQIPNEFDTTSDNYYVLNDKIEFDIGSNGHNRMNLNLTGVDFFGLPFLVQANYQFFYGSSYTNACAVTGMPATVSLDDVYTGYSNALTTLASPFDQHWGGLISKYTNPAGGGGAVCNLRIFAPATAMGSAQSGTNPTPVKFPTNYFLNTATSTPSCTWFNAVWQGTTQSGATAFYQRTNPIPYLILDATTDGGAATATGYEVNDGSFRFSISGGPDAGCVVDFPLPTSTKAFFTGAVADYAPAIVSNASTATNAQLLKVFATSIIGGFFPLDCQHVNPPVMITNKYVQNNSSQYFENNPILTDALNTCPCLGNVPWYDFYSRTLLTIGTPNLFYTSAYSDFLGADGTIVITDLEGHNAACTITVNLADCTTNINYPNPYSDTTVYNIIVGIPGNASVLYGTSATGPWGAIPATSPGNTFFLQVTYTGGIYNGKTVVTQIAPLVKVFHPILPGQGQITTTGYNCNVSIGASPTS